MEKFRVIDVKVQKIRQERLKLERKAKIREAHEVQNTVLHSRTLETEIRVIERQKESAKSRNEKILNEALIKVNDFNENITRSSLKKSKMRLQTAKTQFYEVIMAEFPEWTEAIKDPIMFEKKKYQESLQKLRAGQVLKEEEFRRQMENQLEIVRTKEQYLYELVNEKELAMLREKSKQEFMVKAEQERVSSRGMYDKKKEEISEKQLEYLKEIQEDAVRRSERVSTPNTHIPNELQLKRVKHEENRFGMRENEENLQEFPFAKTENPNGNYRKQEIQEFPIAKQPEVAYKRTGKSPEAQDQYEYTTSNKKKTPPSNFPNPVQTIMEDFDEDDPPITAQVKKNPVLIGNTDKRISFGNPDQFEGYLELPDNSVPIAIVSKQQLSKPVQKTVEKPQEAKPIEKKVDIIPIQKALEVKKEANKVILAEIDDEMPQVLVLNNKKPIKVPKEDHSVPVIRSEKALENKNVSVVESSPSGISVFSKGSPNKPVEMLPSEPKVLEINKSPDRHLSLKPMKIDNEDDFEFEIKTIKSNPKMLKTPEVDLEASIEDSGQLESAYLSNIVGREKKNSSVASSKKDSELGSTAGKSQKNEMRIKIEEQGKISNSPRPEPLSPGSMTSSVFTLDHAKLLCQNKVLNQIPQLQRKNMIETLSNLLRESISKSGEKIVISEIPMSRLEKMYESYLSYNTKMKYNNDKELLGFILILASTIPEPFLPIDLARSKFPFTEAMIREKLSPHYGGIFIQIKDLLVDLVLQVLIDEPIACECFTVTVVNYQTSKSQFERCKQHLSKVLKAGLSRPPTAIKDTSFDNSRVVTPDRTYTKGFSVLKASSANNRSSIDSGIDNFKEVLDEDL